MTQPPSFEPGERRRRPTAPGQQQPQPFYPPQQATPSAPPPSYAPRRRSITNQPGAAPAPTPTRVSPQPASTWQAPPEQYSAPVAATPRRRRRKAPWIVAMLVVALIGWPLWLLYYTNSNLHHVDALVPGPDTPGTTYLLAGSDERPDGWNEDGVEGGRSDSTVMIHKAPNGQVSMVSLPRDTYVDIPGYGWNKLNAAYSFGGPQLLVETVQNLTGLQVDHYAQINMDGVSQLVDAVGTIPMCLDMDVDEPHSGLQWQAGCRDVDGATALALARMRYDDPRGDLGRAQRQREVMSEVANKSLSVGTLINPAQQLRLSRAGTQTISVDETMNVVDVAQLLLTFRRAGELSGTPPLMTTGEMTEVGAVVIIDEEAAPGFFERMRAGELTPADFESEF